MKRNRIVVMGFMASCPISGVVWQHIHYIVGLQRLGHDVYYIEDSARIPYNPETREVGTSPTYTAQFLTRLAADFDFQGRWSYCARYLEEMPTFGLARPQLQQLYREADAILNLCGAQELHEELLVSDRIIYIDSDPGLEQINIAQQDQTTIEYLGRHHALFSFGENVGAPTFPIPAHGMRWLPTRQPIVLDFWKTDRAPPSGALLTTIANWNTSGQKDLEWQGEKYLWSKSEEFLRFADAPRLCGEEFELVTNMQDAATRARFQSHGWRLRDPYQLSADYRRYADYISESKGEFTVAKDQYVRLETAWFSDRSACYLAAGRPVITQETGFSKHYGDGGGLFPFISSGEIVEAVKMINSDYAHHSRAAAKIARECFEAESVLSSLLERAGI
ncbi:MAG: hypothetical protein ABR589_12295 [Chthoniobacterales bacterium]